MTQPAFYFDTSTCIGCKACELACKEKNNLPGGISWRQIYDYGGGEWVQDGDYLVPEDVFTYHVSASCMHCKTPTCVDACGDDALKKRPDGLVIIDSDKCTGCRKCEPACPYDAIHFDTKKGVATKCDFCADLLEVGEEPACVAICPQRCLKSGDLDELQQKFGTNDTVAPLPDGSLTQPAIVIIPHQASSEKDIQKGKILNRYEKNKDSNARVSTRWESTYNPLIPNHSDWLSLLEGESMLMRLLAKGLHDYNDNAWLQSLVDEDIFNDVPFASEQVDVIKGLKLLQHWCKNNSPSLTTDHYNELLADYTQLFTVSFGNNYTPPWESVYRNENQLLFQEQTLQVRSWYQKYGLVFKKIYEEPDDHIALQLFFVAHLAEMALVQLQENNHLEFQEIINSQRKFLSEHLLTWGHHWCEKVISAAKTDFFAGLALVTRGTLSELASILEMSLPKRLKTPYLNKVR